MPASEIAPPAQAFQQRQPAYSRTLRHTYDTWLDRFQARRDQLASHPNGAHRDAPDDEPAVPDTIYDTGLGPVTFAELYQRTSRIVGYSLYSQYGLTNPEDVDDSMQAGYLQVWRQLQREPGRFAGKPLRYIVKAVVFQSKSQRFARARHYRKLAYDADSSRCGADTVSASRMDTWIDLETAITRTAQAVEDHPALLLSLYTVITQTKAQDIRRTFGHSSKALTNGRHEVRARLRACLPGYGAATPNGDHPPQVTVSGPRPQLARLLVEDDWPRPAL